MDRKLLIVFIGLFGISFAIVCLPNFCKSVNCSGISKEACEHKGKDFRPHSTMCGCCDQCIDYLDIGEECGLDEEFSFLLGVPYLQKQCKPGTCCVRNVCQQGNSTRIM